jgi:hypothetical protein
MLSLNKYFQFVRSGFEVDLSMSVPSGDLKHIICRISDVARFVTMFCSLSIKDLKMLAVSVMDIDEPNLLEQQQQQQQQKFPTPRINCRIYPQHKK